MAQKLLDDFQVFALLAQQVRKRMAERVPTNGLRYSGRNRSRLYVILQGGVWPVGALLRLLGQWSTRFNDAALTTASGPLGARLSKVLAEGGGGLRIGGSQSLLLKRRLNGR